MPEKGLRLLMAGLLPVGKSVHGDGKKEEGSWSEVIDLDEIVVVATRTAKPWIDSNGSVTSGNARPLSRGRVTVPRTVLSGQGSLGKQRCIPLHRC